MSQQTSHQQLIKHFCKKTQNPVNYALDIAEYLLSNDIEFNIVVNRLHANLSVVFIDYFTGTL
jgi:hypothetical protein